MSTNTEDLHAAIRRAPEGPQTAAFFDFDGTLIDGYSAIAMLQQRIRRGEMAPLELARVVVAVLRAATGQVEFEELMRVAAQGFRGRRTDELERFGEELARNAIGGSLYPEAWELAQAHRRRGHRVVIASSALPFQVEPLARELGAEHVLCTRLASDGERCTGDIDGAVLWGEGKATAVRELAEREDISLARSFGYANGSEDVEFLSTVGQPRAVNPASGLERVAGRRGWPQVHFAGRARPGVTDAARTAAAYGSMAAAFGLGLGVGALNRSRRQAVNLSMSVGSDLALALAGVQVRVVGEHRLWETRPAVFVFNHQSWLDGLVMMKLLRMDVTGVAEPDGVRPPGVDRLVRLAQMTVLDRAGAALAPAGRRLDEGYSIVMAPEGTCSVTPRPGPFEPRAFSLAMRAGVPIVPVVLRGAGTRLWRGSTVIRPGPVEALVLPPVSVEGWTAADLDDRVSEVEELFAEVLADWDAACAHHGAHRGESFLVGKG
jgi:HAD superfamily hydrolase (TIGR01490 family)